MRPGQNTQLAGSRSDCRKSVTASHRACHLAHLLLHHDLGSSRLWQTPGSWLWTGIKPILGASQLWMASLILLCCVAALYSTKQHKSVCLSAIVFINGTSPEESHNNYDSHCLLLGNRWPNDRAICYPTADVLFGIGKPFHMPAVEQFVIESVSIIQTNFTQRYEGNNKHNI